MSEFGELNTVGVTEMVVRSEYGGNSGKGPIDNVLPTGNVAMGMEVRAGDGYKKGERQGMSIQRNESKARKGSGR